VAGGEWRSEGDAAREEMNPGERIADMRCQRVCASALRAARKMRRGSDAAASLVFYVFLKMLR